MYETTVIEVTQPNEILLDLTQSYQDNGIDQFSSMVENLTEDKVRFFKKHHSFFDLPEVPSSKPK